MLLDETQGEALDTTSQEEADVEETYETGTEEQETDSTDWKKEALKYKAILDRNKGKKEEAPLKENKTDSFGYDVKAYLKASGIKADEFEFVQSELKNFGGDVDALIENEYFQAKLEKQRKINSSMEATPKGKRTGNIATDSVDYWLSKPFADVPPEMRNKVIDARIAKEANKSPFYNS